MPNAAFQILVHEAVDRDENLENLSFIILLWHTGVRKSELYERPLSDVLVNDEFVSIDFHKRKKGGEEVPALDIPIKFFGVQEYVLDWIKQVSPKRQTTKKIYYQQDKQRVIKLVRDKWLFPNIESVKAWRIVKRVLGPKYYPHYLRLRKLSAVAGNPETASITHIKSLSGLKTVSAISAYMGVDKKKQSEAMSNE